MSSSLPWMKFNRGDYLRVTVGWPPLARIAYVELTLAQWDREVLPIESDELHALVPGIDAGNWSLIWPLLDHEFPVVGEHRLNDRIDRLRASTERTHASRRAAAQKAATDARGRFVATPPKPPAASTTKSPSPRSKKAPPSPKTMDLRIFRSPARRQAHPVGRSPRRAARSSRPWRGS